MSDKPTITLEEAVKYVLNFIQEASAEANIVYLENAKTGFAVPARVQMIIAFSLSDVFANYWDIYLDKYTQGTGLRWRTWYDKFCETNENEEYKNNSEWAKLSSARMYKFRNSVVHFFGLSGENGGSYISLMPNDMTDAELHPLRTVLNKTTTTFIIKPHSFYNLVKQGGITMMNDWVTTLKEAEGDETKMREFYHRIMSVYDKIQKEGAALMPLGSGIEK